MTAPSLITEAQIDAAVEARCRREWAPHKLPPEPDYLAIVRETARLMLEAAARESGLSLTPPAAGWDAEAAARELEREWMLASSLAEQRAIIARRLTLARSTAPLRTDYYLRDAAKKLVANVIRKFGATKGGLSGELLEALEELSCDIGDLPDPDPRSAAPSAEAMREAAAKVSEDYNGTVSTKISVRTASSEDLEREYTWRSGERAAARAIAQKIRALPLPPAQPPAVAERDWEGEYNALAHALVGDTGLSAILEAARLRALSSIPASEIEAACSLINKALDGWWLGDSSQDELLESFLARLQSPTPAGNGNATENDQ